jgi:hypothetical protein
VTWQHGDLTLDTGFRLEPPRPGKGNGAPPTTTELHNQWVRAIAKMARDDKEHTP